MDQQRLILAIGRIERALSKLEQAPRKTDINPGDTGLLVRHENLKAATRTGLAEIDDLLAKVTM